MFSLSDRLLAALKEDGYDCDVTTQAFVDSRSKGNADIIAKENGIFCGETLFETLNALFNQTLTLSAHFREGQHFNRGDCLATFSGPVATLLGLERVMLNLLQRSCGIASLTQAYVQALNDEKIQILDTRKTLPLWRDLDRLAVQAGGGYNHRFNLSDMMLIKENHLQALAQQQGLSSLPDCLSQFKDAKPNLKIEIEIEKMQQLESFNLNSVDYVLLDNFSLSDLDLAIGFCKLNYPKLKIEVSGNITLETIKRYRNKAIHRISCGALTHSVPACDLSFLIR